MSMYIPTGEIRKTGTELSDIAQKMQTLSNRASSINSAISGCYMQGGVGWRAGNAAAQMQSIANHAQTKGQNLCVAAGIYEKKEADLYSRSCRVASTIQNGYNVSWANKPAVQCVLGTSITGASVVASSNPLNSVTSSPKKGMSVWKKVWKTGCAVASIVGAGVATAAVWTGAGLSAGLGIPGAAIATAYNVNTIWSKGNDIYNLWWGDETNVGKVNFLKDSLVTSGGELAEMLGGDRKIGETIGKGIYATGNIVAGIQNTHAVASWLKGATETVTPDSAFKDKLLGERPFASFDKYRQGDHDLIGNTIEAFKPTPAIQGDGWVLANGPKTNEVKTYINGLVDIAKNTPLQGVVSSGTLTDPFAVVKYDYSLLTSEVPHLMDAIDDYKAIKDVVGTVKKTAEAFVTPVY